MSFEFAHVNEFFTVDAVFWLLEFRSGCTNFVKDTYHLNLYMSMKSLLFSLSLTFKMDVQTL